MNETAEVQANLDCDKQEAPKTPKIIVPGDEWRQEVQLELAQLTERIVRLRRFMLIDDFYKISEQQGNLLRSQASVMGQYADILTKRLSAN